MATMNKNPKKTKIRDQELVVGVDSRKPIVIQMEILETREPIKKHPKVKYN